VTEPPGPRASRQLILGDQGSIYLHLGSIAKKLGLEKCAELLKGFQVAIRFDVVEIVVGEELYYLPRSALEYGLRDSSLLALAIRGSLFEHFRNDGREMGATVLCLTRALLSIAREREAERLRAELTELASSRRPGFGSMLAKLLTDEMLSKYEALTDMVTEITYLKTGEGWKWGAEADNTIIKLANELGEELAKELAEASGVAMSKVRSALTDNVLREVLKGLKRATFVPSSYVNYLLNVGRSYLAFEGGYLNIRKWFKGGVLEIREGPPEGIVVHELPQRAFEPFKLEDDPLDAIERLAERFTPRLLEAMRSWVPDPEQRLTLWKAMGYTIYPFTPFRKFFVLIGPSGAGKSTFLDFLHEALGHENVSAVTLSQLLGPKGEYYVAELHHKLANLADEGIALDGSYKGIELLKNVVGGSYITGRSLYSRPFKFVNYAKLFFALNDKKALVSPEADEAVRSRMMIIEFPNTFRDNPRVKEGLLKEAPRALPVMLTSLRVLAKEGFPEGGPRRNLLERVRELCSSSCIERSDGKFLSASVIRKELGVSAKELLKELERRGVRVRYVIWHGRRGLVMEL